MKFQSRSLLLITLILQLSEAMHVPPHFPPPRRGRMPASPPDTRRSLMQDTARAGLRILNQQELDDIMNGPTKGAEKPTDTTGEDGTGSTQPARPAPPARDYKKEGRTDALDTTTSYYTGDSICKCTSREAPATWKHEVATEAGKNKIKAVKKLIFQKPGFKLSDALAFADPDFQNYFMESYRAFAEEHAPNHIWFDFKPIQAEADLEGTEPIEWVLIAKSHVHEFAPKGTMAPGGRKHDKFIQDAREAKWGRPLLADQTCCTQRAFRCVKEGEKDKVYADGKMIYPCDIGGPRLTPGTKDLSTDGSQGGRCLNMANFFRQSTDGEVIRLMQGLFKLASNKVTSGEHKVHIYSYGGSRPWLHLRCESERQMALPTVKGHYLWY